MGKEPTEHPDFGELEAYRRREADAAIVEHIEGCAECALHLEEIESLAAVVRRGEPALPPFPQAVDARIVWSAQQHAARVRGRLRRATLQRWAMAASVLLTVGALGVWRTSQQHTASSLAHQFRMGEGRGEGAPLDIVDALALTRQLAANKAVDQRYDLNHDGRVDGADVQNIMRQAVALGDA